MNSGLLTEHIIKQLCGRISYERGEAYYRSGKVAFTSYNPDDSVFKATVKGNDSYQVTVEIDRHGDVDAVCSCPAFYSYDNYCKHIAAVLLHIHEQDQKGRSSGRTFPSLLHKQDAVYGEEGEGHLKPRYSGHSKVEHSGISATEKMMLNDVMELFGQKPGRSSGSSPLLDTREVLEVEFTCKLVPYGYRKHMFGVEMKVGPKRLYIVQKIRDVLERIERRESFAFSKNFTYETELHSFRQRDDAVIRQLIQIHQYERLNREVSGVSILHGYGAGNERLLLIPPYAWQDLLPLLLEAPCVKLEQGGRTYDGITCSDEPVPLQFEFDEAQAEGCQLDVHGLDQITIMEQYGAVLTEGKLLKIQPEACKRLSGLKQLLDSTRKHRIKIPLGQTEAFVEKVLPGLMKLGSVRIAEAVSARMVQTPLKAKLYLDRVKDRLLAGLEFQYGGIVINPLEDNNRKRGEDLILIRDGEQERRILELLETSSFAKTEGGYFMDDEDGEYEFLYHIMPQMEKLAAVYATSAVKARLYTGGMAPKVKLDVDERTDWLEFKFDMEGIPEAEIRQVLRSLEEKRRYHRLPNGALMPLETAEFQEIIRFLNETGIHNVVGKGIGGIEGSGFRVPVVRGLHLMERDRQGNAVKLGKSFRKLLENMRNPDNLDFPVPENLASVLRDYQKYGFQWMKTLAHYRFGGILADDMGLGKTIQGIAFLVSVLPEIRERGQPAIIVSPASLVYNWRNELKKFAPEIRVLIADGSKAERDSMLKDISGIDAVITSYPLLRKDVGLYALQSFHTLILDEAQAFKNHATQTAQAVKELQAVYRFALTGTPVENRLEELWSIYDAVFPGLFPGRREFNELTREAIAKRVRPFLLRRLKTDVLKELPEKIETLQASELLPEQKKLYAAYLAKLQTETLKHLNEEGFQKNRIKILAGLTRLRQLCCHPALFVEGYEGSSSKFEQLLELIGECRNSGKRMLVFSQFTEMLGLIGRELGYQGVPFFYLDGQTPGAERVELCTRFNEGEREIFLISLKAGGTGLNLTGADTVILYDLWWNPAVEQQAADRAHRMGQKNVVQVIRLVAQGTVEDKMYELQQRKKNLIEAVIQPGQEALTALTEQELREILMIG
jgi:superfamily II DNA or RNA helicase